MGLPKWLRVAAEISNGIREGEMSLRVWGKQGRPWGEATADCGRAELGGVEPWLGVEPRLDGLAWLRTLGALSEKASVGDWGVPA
ncbi:hypothetical protein CDL15_Pgr019908 [Punica granatum]|uniref:Uncharacterized protein n=1 Tax=Punica granatum TaxID=22663 RepID=A0A218WJ14_PUNGR|nr:hypothetical protein CDL15_Pgr019908 [Punica granatum]